MLILDSLDDAHAHDDAYGHEDDDDDDDDNFFG